MNKIVGIFLLAVIAFSTVSADADQIGSGSPVTIEGTVEFVEWTPGKAIKGDPNGSTADYDRTFPAGYHVFLSDVKFNNKKISSKVENKLIRKFFSKEFNYGKAFKDFGNFIIA